MVENAIQEQLARLEWMIPDAQRRLAQAAQAMQRRAEGAVNRMAYSSASASARRCCFSMSFIYSKIRVLTSCFVIFLAPKSCLTKGVHRTFDAWLSFA